MGEDYSITYLFNGDNKQLEAKNGTKYISLYVTVQ